MLVYRIKICMLITSNYTEKATEETNYLENAQYTGDIKYQPYYTAILHGLIFRAG